MKRKSCLSLVLIAFVVVASVPLRVAAETKPACCQGQDCDTGIQALPCCQAPVAHANQGTMAPSHNVTPAMAPDCQDFSCLLACGPRKDEDSSELPDDSSLYLQYEVFLI